MPTADQNVSLNQHCPKRCPHRLTANRESNKTIGLSALCNQASLSINSNASLSNVTALLAQAIMAMKAEMLLNALPARSVICQGWKFLQCFATVGGKPVRQLVCVNDSMCRFG